MSSPERVRQLGQLNVAVINRLQDQSSEATAAAATATKTKK